MKSTPEVAKHLKAISEKLEKLSENEIKIKGYGPSSRRLQILNELIKEQAGYENTNTSNG